MDGRTFYAEHAAAYMTTDAAYHARRFVRFNALLPPGRLRIVDYGCGSAENVLTLARMGHEVTGLDPVPEMVARAPREVAGRVRVGDLDALAALPPCDVVGALNVLPYMTDDEEARFYAEAGRLAPVVIVSHGNALVDFVTMNRYTVEAIRNALLVHLPDGKALAETLRGCLTYADAPAPTERDVVTKRRINPLTYPASLEAHGFVVDAVRFHNFYPLPPHLLGGGDLQPLEDALQADSLGLLFASQVLYRLHRR